MANCSCSSATGTRGYGCLSSVPTATSSGIPYNCFLPPTNMSYYQNYPYYNGPCGAAPGSQNTAGGSQVPPNCTCNGNTCVCTAPPSAPVACNPCGCGFRPLFNPCFCCNCNSDEEEEDMEMSSLSGSSGGSSGSGSCCCNPCNPCGCKCKPNKCCGPAAALVTSNGAVTTTAGGSVPLTLVATAANNSVPMPLANLTGPISVVNDAIVFNCPGTYLVFLTVNLSEDISYTGTIGLTLNGSPVSSSVQDLDLSTETYHGTSQALVRVTEGSTLAVTTSAVLTNATATAGSVITVSVIRVA